jgi:thiol-disulfide isomerase/thioredoxin
MKAFVLLLLLLSSPALAEEPQAFVRGSWQGLRQEHTGRPMIVHFWGVTCGPCLAELPRWGEFISEKSGVDVVMVAADPVAGERKAIAGVLAKAGCAAAESWMFADPFTDRLAYEVDPSWAGELPYTLLVGANGSATAILGEVNFSELHAWIVEQARRATGGRS